jgi:hypothetical protein
MRPAILIALVTLAGTASAQDAVYPSRNTWLVLNEALATGAGGVLNSSTTVMHTMRVGVVRRITRGVGLDLSAVRMQTIFPSSGRLNDMEYANPEADAIFLSYAQLNNSRAGGIPEQVSLGLGVARRQTSEAGRTRDTWAARIGYAADPFKRFNSHVDTNIDFNVYLSGSRGNSVVYVGALGLSLRIG